MSRNRVFSICCVFLLGIFVTLASCGPSESASREGLTKVKIEVVGKNTKGDRFGLSGNEPLFIGLGVRGEGMEKFALQLTSGENTIEIPTGLKREFRAALITYKADVTKPVLYYSTASTILDIGAGDDEVSLVFSPYAEVPLFNIYGLVHESATIPAVGAEISVVEPFSGALVTVPGGAQLAKTGVDGSFSFAYFYRIPGFENELTLQVKYKDRKKDLLFPLPKADAVLGTTLPYINLASQDTVIPRFENVEDFDLDGVPNETEIAAGTNPFSALSGAKGDKGDKGDPGIQGIAGVQGATGASGAAGATGTAGANGANGANGISLGFASMAEPPGANCSRGGIKYQNYKDYNGDNIKNNMGGTDVDVGAPFYACSQSGMPLKLSGALVGTLEGALPAFLLQTLDGYKVPLTAIPPAGGNPTTYVVKRQPLFYESFDCSGSNVFARYLGLGQVTYGYSSGTPYISGDNLLRYSIEHKSMIYSDSTCQPTEMILKNFNFGSNMQSNNLNLFPMPSSSNFVFTADNGVVGSELWITDGTNLGTSLVKDVNPGSGSSYISEFIPFNGKLYFMAYTDASGYELWVTDGSTTGTQMVVEINPGTASSYPTAFKVFNGYIYFSAQHATVGTELWRTDGTTVGTTLVNDLNLGTGSSSPSSLTVHDGALYFSVDVPTYGRELWKTDGTTTNIVKDILAGTGYSNAQYLISFPGVGLFFSADDGVNGSELWKSDGTAAGTVLLKDINSNAGAMASSPDNFFLLGNKLLFWADDGTTTGKELWETNGTPGGTVLLKNLNEQVSMGSNPGNLTQVGSTVFFTAQSTDKGTELWKTDGTAAGTVIVKDINVGSNSSYPAYLSKVGNEIYFNADNGVNGNELWKSDGTSLGTVMVKDLIPGLSSSSPKHFRSIAGKIVFAIDSSATLPKGLYHYIPGVHDVGGGHGFSAVVPLSSPILAPGASLSP